MNYSTVTKNPDILGGVPVFRHTRVPRQALLDHLEGGQTLDALQAAIAALGGAPAK